MSMRDLIGIAFDGTYSQIWPMLLLPALAAMISDRAARLLPATRADWRVAAALAAFPGLVMLALIGMVAVRGVLHLHPDDGDHFVKYHVPMIAAAGLLAMAAWRARRRHNAVRQLTDLAHPPSPRLAAAAAAASITVLELPENECECFVAGVVKPVAFVSSGAVSRMSDSELLAALHHERAHAAGRDPAALVVLSFLRDLAPGSERALTAYRQARERIADHEAAKHVGSCALASALLAFARPAPRGALPVLGMAGPDAATWRLQALLGTEPEASAGSRFVLWGSLGANGGLTIWPLPHVYTAYLLCC